MNKPLIPFNLLTGAQQNTIKEQYRAAKESESYWSTIFDPFAVKETDLDNNYSYHFVQGRVYELERIFGKEWLNE